MDMKLANKLNVTLSISAKIIQKCIYCKKKTKNIMGKISYTRIRYFVRKYAVLKTLEYYLFKEREFNYKTITLI